MRIAWVSYSFGEYCVRQAAALARDHDVLLALASDELQPHRHATGGAVVYEFDAPRLRQPLRQAASIRRLVRQVKDFRPDVVHFQHGHLWFNLLGLSQLRRFQLVVTIHDPRRHAGDRSSRKTPQWVLDRGFRRADRAIVHGETLKRDAVGLLGLRAEQVDVTPHVAIGLPSMAPATAEEPHTVLFFGRIWAYKGLKYLIDAAPLVAQRVPDARFIVAGTGDDLAPYLARVREPERFEFINHWIDGRQRSELFARAAVVALPYTEATQSGVTPVAYAHSKPVVASDVGALSECVRHNETGLLTPPRDPRQLADAIVALLTDPARRRQFGAAGRRLVDTEWSPAAVAALNVRCYEQAIAGRRVDAPPTPASPAAPARSSGAASA